MMFAAPFCAWYAIDYNMQLENAYKFSAISKVPKMVL